MSLSNGNMKPTEWVARRWWPVMGVSSMVTLLWLASSQGAEARQPSETTVTSRYVSVADLASKCAPAVCEVVVGRAPPPGSSSLFSVGRVRGRVLAAGQPRADYFMPADVRVRSSAARLSMKQWGEIAHKYLMTALPPGVSLLSAEGKLPVVLPVTYQLGKVSLPPRPRRAGSWRTTVMVEVLHEGHFLRKLPVVVRLELGEEAIRPHVRRGQGLTLTVERKAASISMQGIAMKDAEVGSVLPCRVTKTGRIVRARLRSSSSAIVVETP